MKNDKLKLMELLDNLDKRPYMFSSDLNSFDEYKLYMEGVLYGLGIAYHINFERELSAWFQSKTDFKAPNMVWFEQFKICFQNQTEEEKISIFIATIKNFFEENYF